jgi:hypothetical protein
MKVESKRRQTGFTKCHNCQNFGHIWANCKQPPRSLRYGGDRECPEKTNTESTPSCCNYTLVEREEPHPASYRGCSHAEGELQGRKAQRVPKEPSERKFFYKFTSPEQSYSAALRQDNQNQQPKAPQTEEKSIRYPVQQIVTTGIPEKMSVSTGSQFVQQYHYSHCSASDHDRAQWSCVRKRQSNGH